MKSFWLKKAGIKQTTRPALRKPVCGVAMLIQTTLTTTITTLRKNHIIKSFPFLAYYS
jgi:hypothetical protein